MINTVGAAVKHGLEIFIGAVSVLTVLALASMVFFYMKEGQDVNSKASGKMTKLIAEMGESDLSMYDGVTVSGNEVVNAIKKFTNDEISVQVINKAGVQHNYIYSIVDDSKLDVRNTKSVQSAQVKGSANYINPTGQFKGELVRDKNDVLLGIRFTQV